ncbi:MAG TPA: AI-2E family transporter [Rhizomicrobium sp.]|jgi:predicted PurR-regulated permease PerM|nr:AI-2E family transporter [Rhizomicrobium sp.]
MTTTPAAPPAPDPQEQVRLDRLQSTYMSAVIAAVVVLALYFGRPILVPLALAILIAFALSPLLRLLRKLRLGRVLSVLLSVLFAIVVMIGLGTFIGSQAAKIAAQLPLYQTNLLKKVQSIRGAAANSGLVRSTTAVLNNIGNEVAGAQGTTSSPLAPRNRPVPVQIVKPRTTPIEVIENVIGPLVDPLISMTIVIVFVGFILLQKEDLRDRFIRLAGYQDLQRTTLALDEAADRLSHYLFSQTIINTCFGAIAGTCLWLIGIPNAGLWGLLSGIMRFIPYVGVPLSALFPLALGIAVDPGWAKVVWTAALYFTIEPVTGQLIEPVVYGRNMGLSAVAVVVAAIFWTWLWGPVGLLLSTPLTMCLVVMGRHVEPLEFLDVLLGDKPPLAAEESLYLRMLAGDPDTAALEAEAFVRNNSLMDFFDEITIKALALAQRDHDRGVLKRDRLQSIRETVDVLIENLSDRDDVPEGVEGADESTPPLPADGDEELPESWRGRPVLCVSGRSALDEAAAALLAHVVEKHGIGARVVSASDVSPTQLARLDVSDVQVVCVSYLDPGNYKNARYLVKRLKKRMPQAHPIAGFWGYAESDSHYLDSIEAMEMDDVVSSLSQAVERILALAQRAKEGPTAEPTNETVARTSAEAAE